MQLQSMIMLQMLLESEADSPSSRSDAPAER